MGYVALFQRELFLTMRVNILQSKISDISQQRLDLTETITQFTTQISDIGNNDSEAANAELNKASEAKSQLIQTSAPKYV